MVLGSFESGPWVAEVDGAACLGVDSRGSRAAGTASQVVGRPFSDRSCASWQHHQDCLQTCHGELHNLKTRLVGAWLHGDRTCGRACREKTKDRYCRHRDE